MFQQLAGHRRVDIGDEIAHVEVAAHVLCGDVYARVGEDRVDLLEDAGHIPVGVEDAVTPPDLGEHHVGEVHGPFRAAVEHVPHEFPRHLDADVALRFLGGAADVGREHDVPQALQRGAEGVFA